jgi:hypothetical protein
MATFHAKGKAKFIVPFDEFGISRHKEMRVQCSVSIQELFMFPRMMHMIPTTLLLDYLPSSSHW